MLGIDNKVYFFFVGVMAGFNVWGAGCYPDDASGVLRELISVQRELCELDRFAREREGARLGVCWPDGAHIIIQGKESLSFTDRDVFRLSRDHLCCEEELVILGSAVFVFDVDMVVTGTVILVGDTGSVYMFNRYFGSGLYFLADDCLELFRNGFRLCEALYSFTPLLSLGWPDECTYSLFDIIRFAETHKGAVIGLPWPADTSLMIDVPDDPVLRWPCVHRGYSAMALGRFVGRNMWKPLAEWIVVIDRCGGVCAVNMRTSQLRRLAPTLRSFLNRGPKGLFVNFCFVPRYLREFTLPVACPHVRGVELPSVYNIGVRDAEEDG
ncbi:tegument protein [Suid betaherpesvirus 2]|uniref:Tegument protein n=1 Tax=Suid betaherpesvirus 2 TaxID=1608255 RepID=U3GTA9_9BETA|nr:tegument protein [Suid betaherpesvirus 2]AGT99202.1 tegument protein [Suid betaherpesvirus 2]